MLIVKTILCASVVIAGNPAFQAFAKSKPCRRANLLCPRIFRVGGPREATLHGVSGALPAELKVQIEEVSRCVREISS